MRLLLARWLGGALGAGARWRAADRIEVRVEALLAGLGLWIDGGRVTFAPVRVVLDRRRSAEESR